MKTFEIVYTISGRASATVEANSKKEALEKAKKFEIEEEELIEWDYEDVEEIIECG